MSRKSLSALVLSGVLIGVVVYAATIRSLSVSKDSAVTDRVALPGTTDATLGQ